MHFPAKVQALDVILSVTRSGAVRFGVSSDKQVVDA
jgi:hypothetical protein